MSHLTSIHEAMHAVAGAICLAGIPGLSPSSAKVSIWVDDDACGDGECALILSDHARARVQASYVNAWAACGPLGFLLDAKDIGLAIAEGRQGEKLSDVDCKLALRVGAVDQFVAAVGARKWLSLIGGNGMRELDAALREWDSRYFSPFVPLDVFCPAGLAGRLRLEARHLVTKYLPARAVVGSPTRVEIV